MTEPGAIPDGYVPTSLPRGEARVSAALRRSLETIASYEDAGTPLRIPLGEFGGAHAVALVDGGLVRYEDDRDGRSLRVTDLGRRRLARARPAPRGSGPRHAQRGLLP